MKRSTRTIHTVCHRVELDASEVHRIICKAVMAPENASVGSVNTDGDILVEWDVVREEPVFIPPQVASLEITPTKSL